MMVYYIGTIHIYGESTNGLLTFIDTGKPYIIFPDSFFCGESELVRSHEVGNIPDKSCQNDQDSVRESINAWISGLGYF